uniref:Pectinesterase n=1 Tax=Oryza punctata TaxID=4537 RepID=A0A0E0JHI2_ORYPU
MKQVLAPMIALVIGIGALAFMAVSPQVCHAAAGGSAGGATVARSIFVNNKGGADFTRIQDAINSVPFGNNRWIRIHIAAGVYREKVSIPANKSFILLEGEGRQQTSIEWADHAGGGGDSGTADSPTFASYAADFMARDITFKNTYGRMAPAVAALVAGDRSSFYRCGFVGLQDTLSDLLGRHYYERCYVEGAVDFIFGEGQSIFQGCEISTTARSPAVATPGFITAQGRSSGSDASGFVFRSCTVGGATPAYLGRAWRGYARVVFYQTAMSAAVVSLGWDAWDYKGEEETLEMVESGCTGPGSNRTGRVAWEKTLSRVELAKLVDISYVSRDGWLAAQPR